jgi:hypothetical protein
LSRLTAIVHTSDRPHSIERLVGSLGWLCPQMRVLVADDGRKSQPVAGADLVRLPPGAGASAARNALLARVRTPYFLLLEDDLELGRRSQLDRMLALAAANELDIAAGELVRRRRRFVFFTSSAPDPGHATLDVSPDTITVKPGCRAARNGYLSCDATHNFFVGRTDKVRGMGGWDSQLKADERIEFFVRAQRHGLRVGVCPDSIAWRWAERTTAARRDDFTSLALAKMGVSRLVDADGQVHEAPARLRAA